MNPSYQSHSDRNTTIDIYDTQGNATLQKSYSMIIHNTTVSVHFNGSENINTRLATAFQTELNKLEKSTA